MPVHAHAYPCIRMHPGACHRLSELQSGRVRCRPRRVQKGRSGAQGLMLARPRSKRWRRSSRFECPLVARASAVLAWPLSRRSSQSDAGLMLASRRSRRCGVLSLESECTRDGAWVSWRLAGAFLKCARREASRAEIHFCFRLSPHPLDLEYNLPYKTAPGRGSPKIPNTKHACFGFRLAPNAQRQRRGVGY
jgi:hypothetical protein